MTFEDAVDAVLRPKNQSASGVLRCADLYCGDGEATQAALDLGMRVVYAYDPSEPVCVAYLERFGQEPFAGSIEDSIEVAPEFDLLLARLRQRNQKEAVEHALRFMRERRVAATIFWGRGLSDDFVINLAATIEAAKELSDFTVGQAVQDSGPSLIIATRSDEFEWPSNPSLKNVIKAVSAVAS